MCFVATNAHLYFDFLDENICISWCKQLVIQGSIIIIYDKYNKIAFTFHFLQDLESVVPDPKPFCFHEQLQAFGKFLKAGKYPAFEKQGDIFKNCLRNILEPIM